ncbi:MAG: cobalamin biosynthesis protein, partial [Selenomonadaceae bacterium]|nr:cobalamin biosynthesis protein [Selenomonadaceae bacterium]
LLFVLSAMLLRDAGKHPSPNGGWAEASVAGALDIRLGGYNSYFGRESFRAYMGEPIEELAPKHIPGCTRLMYTATILFLFIMHIIQQVYMMQ